jgi:nucleoside-diphosphate kinase
MLKYLLLLSTTLLAEQTFSIIKPDAVQNDQIGAIQSRLESAGLHITAAKLIHLTPAQAATFYATHSSRPFYPDLITYMTSGPVLVQILEAPDAVALNRRTMGATDPALAAPDTIRADFGTSIQHNAVHGSDSPSSAQKEIALFFTPSEIHPH